LIFAYKILTKHQIQSLAICYAIEITGFLFVDNQHSQQKG